jgi:hypothetical protein
MKKYLLSLLFITFITFGQKKYESDNVDVAFIVGNVLPHSKGLNHLITGHPNGYFINYSKSTLGDKEWHKVYDYPDYGVYFIYMDYKNEILRSNYAVGAHYNFYFLNRNVVFKIAEGIGVASNPYDKVENSKNIAFGSKILANTNFMLSYKKANIIDHVGFQAGIIFTHFSNGRMKSPNSGINTYNINVGLNYNLDDDKPRVIDTISVKSDFKEPVKYNFIIRSGVNESLVVGSGQHPFFHVGVYADKRLGRKSALQLGSEVFFSMFYKDYIKYQSVAFPDQNLNMNTDYKRAGVFIGHELFINRISIEAQLGYYVYQPYKFDSSIYDRIGIKYYYNKNVFGGLSVKTHLFLAEAIEFGVGVRI